MDGCSTTGIKRLTRIEILDHDHPGLADQLREWFLQGIPVRKIPPLVLEKYNLRVSDTHVARFRRRHWVRELDLAREKRIEAFIEQELAHGPRRRSVMNPSRRGRKVAGNV